jgi:flagellar biosynthetic protein FliR
VLVLFSLVLARTTGLLLGAPVFSATTLPRRFRMGLAVLLSLALLPAAYGRPMPEDGYAVAGAMAVEGLLGFSIGLLVRMVLAAFQLAGGMISFQAGFAMTAAFDPMSGTRSTVLQTLHLNLVTVLFLVLDGHHLLVRSLAASYETIPVATTAIMSDLTSTLFAEGKTLFQTGAVVAAPVTGLLLLINATVGFLNRIMPQLSIFNIGFPMTVFTGMVAVFLSIPGVTEAFLRSFEHIEVLLASLFGG